MKKTKILICGLSNRIGGIEIFVLNYMKKINMHNFQVDFINVYDKNTEVDYYNELKKYGEMYYLSNYRKHPIKFINQIIKLQKQNGYDIFHYNMASCAYIIPLIAAKKAKIRNIISHAHNDASDKGLIKEIVHKINKRFLAILSNYYFSCSDNAAKWFFSKNIYKKQKYQLIENAVDIEKFLFNAKKRNYIRKKLQILDSEKVYGHVGNFKKIKNHDFLIDVFFEIQNQQPNAKLMLIGVGETIEEIKNKVHKLGIDNKVLFLGKKNNVSDYLSAMDVFIFPSKHEGLGISYIEAQISGLPCVVSNGVPEQADLSDNIHRISLAENIKIWAKHSILLSKYSIRDFFVEDCKYDINFAAKKLEKIYQQISKLKIVHFVYGIRNGGVEKVLTSYFSNINRDLFELHIITQGESDNKNLQEFLDLDFFVHNVTKKRTSLIKNFRETIKILKKYKFDISHCHMSNTNFFPLLYSLICKIKVRINHSHNAFAKKKYIENILMKLSNLLCTHKFACSVEAAEWLFGENNNAMILQNAIYTNKFVYDENARNNYRKLLNIKNDDFIIGMIARFEEQKNHKFIFEVMKNIINDNKNVKVVFIGVGPLEHEIKEKAQKNNIIDNFFFLSSRNDVNKLYSLFDIFVLPSLYEGLGIVLIEAQISGLNCITSKYVPKSVNFSGNVKFLELKTSLWEEEIKNNLCNKNRNNYLKLSNRCGYDIIVAAKKLEKFYIDCYENGVGK